MQDWFRVVEETGDVLHRLLADSSNVILQELAFVCMRQNDDFRAPGEQYNDFVPETDLEMRALFH
jgi:hypothetical protein